MSDDRALLKRICAAQDDQMAGLTIPIDLAQRARDGVRRRRNRSRTAGATLGVLLAVAATAVGYDQRQIFSGQPATTTVDPLAAAQIDGILIGYLPPGYRLTSSFPTMDYQGEIITESRYNTVPDPQGAKPGVKLRRGDISVTVWRVRPDRLYRYSSMPGSSPTTKNRVTLRDGSSTWENTRQERTSTLSTVTVTGVEVPASTIDRIATSLTETHPWTPPAPS
jgi:hypothetical protein